ncbi:MAG TPA: translational GTPase TypA [Gemmataceae bacterium]|nr:translational GTPase TypA [Gemmataceae bacterium]
MKRTDLRNIAIIAHVDHGKTTLVDQMLRQSGMFRESELRGDCILDSNDLERERGITILAKNIALRFGDTKINIIDTPGHADFGGEVERVLKMADGALLLVDAAEGVMPQTRFVLRKAFACGLRPIVVINKIDRPDARPVDVLNGVFDLFVELDADDATLDFPTIYASGRDGIASADSNVKGTDILPLFDAILKHVPPPEVEQNVPLQMLVVTLDYSDYVGRIGIGRVVAGKIKKGQRIALLKPDGRRIEDTVAQLYVFDRLGRTETDEVSAGDLCAVVGLEEVHIGDTIADLEKSVALPPITVDEPTLEMIFRINDSPFVGQDGTYVTSRQLRERLLKELESNVALRVTPDEIKRDEFHVAGRGLLHLGILLENMRREGYELSVGKPRVITKEIDGQVMEPIEYLVIEAPPTSVGSVMELVGNRRAECVKMEGHGEVTHMEFTIPARGLIGLGTRLMTATSGEAIVHHNFYDYEPVRGSIPTRLNGVMISTDTGRTTAFALDNLQLRGNLFVGAGEQVYEGQILAEHCRDNDLPVNACREKKLTNMRAAGSDKSVILKPPRQLTLELALEYIEDDELVEVTPKAIRLRKMYLKENDRKRFARQAQA